MAIGKNIKGITIEFNGDTTKLGKAITDVDKKTRGLDKDLKGVDRALKFNPGNTELIAQKQQLLGQKVEQTKDKLNALKQAQAKLDDDPAVDKTSQDYMELRREIIETESKLKTFEKQLKDIGNVNLTALGTKMKDVGDKMKQTGKSMTQYVTAPIVAGFGAAVKKTMDFDTAVSQVAATMGLTTEQMEKEQVSVDGFTGSLRDLAVEMGSKTAFSATQAAEALNYMALAGYDAQTSAEMLPKVLDLAAAGGMELAEASDMITDSQSALGLSIEDTTVLVDQMARTSSKSNTSVSQLGSAILTVGGTAKMMKGGITEMNSVLGVLADNGVKGSEGGTALRNILLSLGSPTDKAAGALKALGIEVYDAEGNMKDLRDLMPEMAGALDKLTQEDRNDMITKIFNKRDLKSVNALLATSKDRWDELDTALGDSAGAASQMASTQLDNLGGSLTILKSALEGLAINVGDVLTPYIKQFAEWITTLVDKFNGLSPTAQKVVVVLGAIAAAIGPLLVVGGVLLSSVGQFIIWLPRLAGALTGVTKAVGLLSKAFTFMTGPVGIAIAAIAAAIAIGVVIYKNWDKIKEFLINAWEKIKEVATAVWGAIKDTLVRSWTDIKELAVGAWEGIKTFFASVLEAIKKVFTTAWNAIKTATTTVFNGIKTFFVTIFKGIKLVFTTYVNIWKKIITTVFNAIKAYFKFIFNAYKTVFTTAFGAIKNTVSRIFNRIKDAITKPIEKAKDIIKGIVDKIKSFFNFDFKLPHIKLPHFSIHPKGWQLGDLLEGSIPSLGIDWYAKGGIFRSPSVIGVGERGPEAVLPIEKLNTMLAGMADNIVNGITMGMALQGAGQGGDVTIPIYLYPSGPKMGEETVRMYDQYKKILG